MKLVITTTSNKKSAKELANALISENLAACVSIIKAKSLYLWQGELNSQKERILLIKTQAKFKKIAKFIRQIHEYDTPEILAFKPKKADKRYKKWVKNSTKKEKNETLSN